MANTSGWKIIILRAADKEMQKQPARIRTRFTQLLDIVRRKGFDDIPASRMKQLTKEIWELRVWGKNTTARTLYLKKVDRRVIIVRVFTKKDRKTPPSELKLALKRAKEYENAQ